MLTGEVPFHGETPVAVAMKPRARADPRRAAAAPRSLGGHGLRRRPRRRQGPRPPLPRRRRAWSPTSRRCSRSRPSRIGPGDRRGRRACCARCPDAPAGGCPAHAPSGALGRLAGAARARSSRSRSSPAAPAGAQRHRRRARRARRRRPAGGRRSARPPRTTTTRSAPAPKTTTACRTSSTATPTPPGARRTTTKARSGRPAASASASTSTPSPASPRAPIEIQTPDARLRRADLRRATASTCPTPTATPRRSPRAAGRPARLQPRRAQPPAHRLDRRRDAYRYYLIWLTTLPPGPAVGVDRRTHAVQVARALRTRGRALRRMALDAPAGTADRPAPGRGRPSRAAASRRRSSA